MEKWSDAVLEAATKKDLIELLQAQGNTAFILRHRLKGKVASIAKTRKKPELDAAYHDLFATGDFRTEEDDLKEAQFAATKLIEQQEKETASKGPVVEETAAPKERKRFTRQIKRQGDKMNFPKKGSSVRVYYSGMLDDGMIFDTNTTKKGKPLTFTLGVGKVIRGWDEAVLEMSLGELARVVIEPEWAYGAKGSPPTIPPNATLTFDIELLSIQ